MLVFRSSGRVLGESPFGVPGGLVRSIVFRGSGRVLGESPFGVPGGLGGPIVTRFGGVPLPRKARRGLNIGNSTVQE